MTDDDEIRDEFTKEEYVECMRRYLIAVSDAEDEEVTCRHNCPIGGKNFLIPSFCPNGNVCDLCKDFISLEEIADSHKELGWKPKSLFLKDRPLRGENGKRLLGCPCLELEHICNYFSCVGEDASRVPPNALKLAVIALDAWDAGEHKWQKQQEKEENNGITKSTKSGNGDNDSNGSSEVLPNHQCPGRTGEQC